MKIRYSAGIVLAALFSVFWWGKSWAQFWQATSLLMLVAGTYLITKTTFVEFMLNEYKIHWENWKNPRFFFRIACWLYSISLNDLNKASEAVAPDFEKFRKATSFLDPFRGFLWVSIGSLIQLILILRNP